MISICLATRTNVKLLCLFSQTPGKALTRKDIQQLTQLANNPLTESLTFLVNTSILLKQKRHYTLNFENDEVNNIIDFFSREKRKLKNLPYPIWLILFDLSIKLTDKIAPQNIYLFGSYAKLIAHEKSDIDIAIVIEKREPHIDFAIEKQVSILEKRFQKKIQIHLFDRKEFQQKTALTREILKDSIKIY